MPTKSEVASHVINIIAAHANLKPSLVKPEHILADPPLSLDSTGLGFLTLSIRGYIKSIKADQTITAGEVRKSGLTVQNLIDNVYNKIK